MTILARWSQRLMLLRLEPGDNGGTGGAGRSGGSLGGRIACWSAHKL